MNTPEQNNYVQYVNLNGKVKTKSVVFQDNGENTTFQVKGIIEPFFILAVFQNNLKVVGVGFDDIENNDMLGFVNSNFVDLDTIPNNAFLESEQVVTMSYNNEYLKRNLNPQPDPQEVKPLVLRDNEYLYFQAYLDDYVGRGNYSIYPYQNIGTGVALFGKHVYYCKSAGKHELEAYNQRYMADFQFNTDSHFIFTACQTVLGGQTVLSGYKAILVTDPFEQQGGGSL